MLRTRLCSTTVTYAETCRCFYRKISLLCSGLRCRAKQAIVVTGELRTYVLCRTVGSTFGKSQIAAS